ncbi:translation protein SH3-like domain-containing protein [Podospora conica]|nr:translation protein SH3-like domain-containing protein [Schizothecium conicum]
MNAAPLCRRPLGCLKTSLRQAGRQTAVLGRTMATATETPAAERTPGSSVLPDHNFYQLMDSKTKKVRSAFAVYAPPIINTTLTTALKPLKGIRKGGMRPLPVAKPLAGLLKPPSDPMPLLHAAQIRRMDPTGARAKLFEKTRHGVRPGDVLIVTHRRNREPFAGVCISIRRAGIDTAILLRTALGKVGVEMWYKVYNKNVAGIEIVKRPRRRARRARLTYMRLPKHDPGNQTELVLEWKKSRKALLSKAGAAKKTGPKKSAKKKTKRVKVKAGAAAAAAEAEKE